VKYAAHSRGPLRDVTRVMDVTNRGPNQAKHVLVLSCDHRVARLLLRGRGDERTHCYSCKRLANGEVTEAQDAALRAQTKAIVAEVDRRSAT
jgi:alpha-tubulin suppressor-like RCC1 family protein